MKQNLLSKMMLLIAVLLVGAGTAWATDVTYKLTIDASSFNTTSYAANNNEKTSNAVCVTDNTKTFEVTWTSSQVMKSSTNMQWQKSKGCIYNSTDLGTITGVTVTSSAGSFTTYYGEEEQPSSSTTVGGGFFQIKVGGATGTVSKIEVTFTVSEGGDTNLEESDLALEDSPVELEFDLYNNASPQVINYTTSSTGAVTIADSEYATFAIDEVNKTITVTPTAKTSDTETITVNQAADEIYNAGSTTFTVTITDSTPIPTHTVTFSINGVTTTDEVEEGAAIVFPEDPEAVSGKTFVGWVVEAIDGTTNDAPTFVTSATMGQSDVTYYAVFAFANGGGSSEVIKSYGFETESDPDWTITDAIVRTEGQGNTGSYAGKINTNHTYITFNSKVKVKEFSFAFKRTSTNSNYNVYIETSEDNSTWTAVETYTMGSFNNGSYSTNTKEFDGTQELYVRFHCYNTTAVRYVDDVTIKYVGGGVTYSDYCTTVVAATVARPTIEVAENPFMFSTTATITCETEGAAIKYSFDGENWNDYTEELTITATTTIYAKAIKDANESTVASVTATKNLAIPTVVIDATGITNTNVFDGTEAGSLAVSVTYNDEAIEGATVTWSSSNDAVATIDEEGNVTLVAAGTVAFTATYAGNEDYSEKTATYEMTVTNSDPNAPGTENNPYTVAEIIEFIETLNGGTSDEVFVKGIISQIDSYNSKYNSITYWISDDGTTSAQFECYSGLGLNGAAFSSIDDLQIGDEVVVAGTAKKYGYVYEFNYNNYIVSLVRVEKPAAPTFSVAAGTYTVAQSVELSTTTEGATIYYTVDGLEPTAESTEYTEAIEVTETTTIKAIAVKDDVASDVATATYTINTTPSIDLGETTISAPYEGLDGTIDVTYNNLTDVLAEVQFVEADGTTPATYSWVAANIDTNRNIEYIIEENTSTDARTAYMKVYAVGNEGDAYSELITITQAGFVAPPTPGEWVETALADLTFADVFVIVGNNGSTYALSNDNGTSKAPDAVEVEVVDNTLSGEIADNIKWTISGNATDGYTFYPYGSYNSWLYCTNTNNGVRVGTNDTNNAFTFDGDYLYNTATDRYVGIYNSQDWRCYTTYTGNIADQTVKFYRKLTTSQTVTVSAAGYATLVAARDLEIPSGVEVYAVEVKGNYALLNQVTAGIPEGEAVVVKADEGEYVFNYATEAVSELVVTNDLIAATAPVKADGTQYVLAKPAENEEVGFYKATVGSTIAVGKAYLEITGEAPVKGFTFKFGDDATSINEELRVKSEESSIYNLAGQRVSKMQRGINIVNGKKLLK